jgi:hypothetical protein
MYDNVNKKYFLLDDNATGQQVNTTEARIIKAVPLNVNKNSSDGNQSHTAELEAISDTQFKVSIRWKDGSINNGFSHEFTIGDWSGMKTSQKAQLFDYYFQIVSGDFNGDGCDDIAYYWPEIKNWGTSTTRTWKIKVVFLKDNNGQIQELPGAGFDILKTDAGFGSSAVQTWESTPAIHLSVTNLNKDSNDDLVVVRGWTKPANGTGIGKDGASTVYIFDNLKNRNTTPTFLKNWRKQGLPLRISVRIRRQARFLGLTQIFGNVM